MKSSRPRPTPSRPNQIRPGFTPSSPSRCRPIRSSSKMLSMSAIQLRTTSAPAQLPCHFWRSLQHKLRKPRPSRIGLCRDHLGPVSAESDSATTEGSQYSIAQICAKPEVKPNPDSTNNFAEQMENNNDRTLKELATPNYPQLEPAQTYEGKSGLIHLLSKFHGLAGEDPHKHLKEFHVVCSTMKPQGISKEYI
ncbi:hypothetical protein CR513_04729, partial [Mucuna pruriens]